MSPIPDKVSESFKRLNPKIYAKNNAQSIVPHAESKCDKAPALGGTIQGEKESIPSTTVRFTGYRVRRLDPDNFAGGCKDLLDGLRHAGLIKGDEWWRITLETRQVKVDHFEDEYTIIEVDSE